MRWFSMAVAAICVPLLLFAWLPFTREIAAPVSVYRDLGTPLLLALLLTASILLVLRIAHRHDSQQSQQH